MPRSAYDALLLQIHEEFPKFQIIAKEQSPLHRLIDKALVVLTCGKMRTYLSGYHTTLGQRVYVPRSWQQMSEEARYVVLCHERVHMRQFRRYTWLGMTLLYLALPLPMGLAYCRAHFEMEAYAESIRAEAQLFGMQRVREVAYREHIIAQFCGASYGWMWPFRSFLNRWYDQALASAEQKKSES